MTDWNEAHAILCKEHAELTAKYSLLLARTEAEQRVLDACAAVPHGVWRIVKRLFGDRVPAVAMFVDAELARRGLKP